MKPALIWPTAKRQSGKNPQTPLNGVFGWAAWTKAFSLLGWVTHTTGTERVLHQQNYSFVVVVVAVSFFVG